MKAAQLHGTEEMEKSHNHQHSSNGEKHDPENILIDVFRWSRCKKPLPQKVMRSVGIPLPLDYLEVVACVLRAEKGYLIFFIYFSYFLLKCFN